MQINEIKAEIFKIKTEADFNRLSLAVFKFQYENNTIYRSFVDLMGVDEPLLHYKQIPFLPISFFKTQSVVSGNKTPEIIFKSSGTTGENTSNHYVLEKELYEDSFKKAFNIFYPEFHSAPIIALLPSYLEREGSSLIYMIDQLIKSSNHKESGFCLELDQDRLDYLQNNKEPKILIGVTFALVELAKKGLKLNNTTVFETGGMKGRGKELVREELHELLIKGLGVDSIHSEYGMTELLSQAYSLGDGLFNCPPWMKVLIRETTDPRTLKEEGKGSINVIDLANIHSCSFIATDDLGNLNKNSSFEVLGRVDNSQLRGCNLLI